MNDDEVRQYIADLLQPTLEALDDTMQRLNAVEQRLQQGLAARLLVVAQELAERQARQLNAMGMNDARFAALIAFVAGQDVEKAFVASREVFRERHPAAFDDAFWRTEPRWLAVLRRR